MPPEARTEAGTADCSGHARQVGGTLTPLAVAAPRRVSSTEKSALAPTREEES
jgi:hypothetical protein